MVLLLTLACAPAPPAPAPPEVRLADVLSVEVGGEPGAYELAVEVASPDTGCDRYADWWEALTPDGALVFRRILTHSHPDEQPFVRAGGPVPVAADAALVVRAHLHPDGYGGAALAGTVAAGFAPTSLPAGFAASLAEAPPLPEGCLF